jgi:NADH dehydrogenase FAD-containing subunit
MMPHVPHVLILGGGFGGLWATRALASAPLRVTLVDRTNHHLFQPLLYQVAMAGLSSPDIAAPLRHILRQQRNVTVRMDEALAIDVAARRVTLAHGALDYDYLVVATGARHAYFGHDEWARRAPGLKTLDDALHIRRHVLEAPGVQAVHDLHAWTITNGMNVVSAHVVLQPDANPGAILDHLGMCLADDFDVDHSTFQLETPEHVLWEGRASQVQH